MLLQCFRALAKKEGINVEELLSEKPIVIKEAKEEIKAEEKPLVVEEVKVEEPIAIKEAKEEARLKSPEPKAKEEPIVIEEANAEEKPIVKEEFKVEKPIVIKRSKESPRKNRLIRLRLPHMAQKKPTSFEKECAEKVKNMTPGKGKLSSMLPGKPKCRCIHLSFHNVCCDKKPAKENKYCKEHIDPQCPGHKSIIRETMQK